MDTLGRVTSSLSVVAESFLLGLWSHPKNEGLYVARFLDLFSFDMTAFKEQISSMAWLSWEVLVRLIGKFLNWKKSEEKTKYMREGL